MTAQRFAFYGRVQHRGPAGPAAREAVAAVAGPSRSSSPHGGVVVAEFFDIGQSRSLPWKRRPEAARAARRLQATRPWLRRGRHRRAGPGLLRQPVRPDASPCFIHYGVELWVPEVGGKVDPGSDAHDLVMSLYGGM